YNELNHARRVAGAFQTNHHDLVLEPNVLERIEDLAWYLDEPFGDASAIPTYMVSKLAAEHVKVVLSGDGGGELVAGYDTYLVEQRERKCYRLPGPARRIAGALGRALPEGMRGRNLLRHASLAGFDRYFDSCTFFRSDDLRRLFVPEVSELFSPYDPGRALTDSFRPTNGDWLSALQYLDVKRYLPLDILTKVDRMSMAHSIEARVPLLDHKLVEFAATIPPKF